MKSHLNYPPLQSYLIGSFLALLSRHADKLWDLHLKYLEFLKNTTTDANLEGGGGTATTLSLQVTQEVSDSEVENCQTGPWESGLLHRAIIKTSYYHNSLTSYLREGEAEGQGGPDWASLLAWWMRLSLTTSKAGSPGRRLRGRKTGAKCKSVGTETTYGGR